LFRTLKDNIRVVFLNACYSCRLAEAIVENIDFVIGMSAGIEDQAARVFAARVYGAIGFGRSIQEAFDQGKAALLLEGIPEDDTPQLLTRTGADPSKARLIQSPAQIVDNARRVLRMPRKQISVVEEALYGVRALLHDLSDPSWLTLAAGVEGRLSSLRDEIVRATEGAASWEAEGQYEWVIQVFRSAIRRGFDEVVDDATGLPINTATALRRAIDRYVEHSQWRIQRRYTWVRRYLDEGYPNAARQVLGEAAAILKKAEQYDSGSLAEQRRELMVLDGLIGNSP
jgi:hypothetical protein